MILILSEDQDRTTTEVIRWLVHFDLPFIRVHEDEIFSINIEKERIYLESSRNSFFIEDISSVWYRRGGLNFNRIAFNDKGINLHMNEYQYWLEDYVIKFLEGKRGINQQSRGCVNKLIALEKAIQIGLDVPEFFLSDDLKNIPRKDVITKTVSGNCIIEFDEFNGIMYTAEVTDVQDEEIFISFFQQKITKDFEIRTFYMNEQTWSMAIFSQNDSQTQIDYRKYNKLTPNRNVRYNLPDHLNHKIVLLMEELGLNCGSLDFIKSGETFYFLEVNPIGQFGNVSTLCNFMLDKELALAL